MMHEIEREAAGLRPGLVLGIVRESFPDLNVRDLSVSRQSDHDGDLIYRIVVTLGGTKDEIGEGVVTGLTREIRNALLNEGDEAFPIVYIRAPEFFSSERAS